MAHKQCLKGLRLNHLCDCIKDDITELEMIKNNINNLEKLINLYFKIYKTQINIKSFSDFLKLRLVVENELEE